MAGPAVFTKGTGKTYCYDFIVAGQRYQGNTELTDKRRAAAVAAALKEEAKAGVKREDAAQAANRGKRPWTLEDAVEAYLEDEGKHLAGEGPQNAAWSAAWLLKTLGAGILIRDIGPSDVQLCITRRKAEKSRNGGKLAPATINRSVRDPLRKILFHAARRHEQTIRTIDWAQFKQAEPVEIPRELAPDEEARLFDATRDDFAPIVEFAILSGLRQSELVELEWRHVDFGNRVITVDGKGGKVAPIPMSSRMREILFPLQGHHATRVFTYLCDRTKKGVRIRGQRYPLTASGLKTMHRRTAEKAGLENYRWHDHRHTAATRVVRATGSLKIAQKLLRHGSIAMTARYAHASDQDIRDALDLVATRQAVA